MTVLQIARLSEYWSVVDQQDSIYMTRGPVFSDTEPRKTHQLSKVSTSLAACAELAGFCPVTSLPSVST
ncbi:Choline dehydrogenase or related flavoprotein [Pseudomonas syringae pv. actinidiae]|uniref:Choline dehydrogenase or related flavoprotein n=1 Tax=Pseudomonas syringae pv. actinidiae TaxID=103796 RepID=A0A2V0QFZ8_PSESF|nr:Choline dehydrogenase or related flavoprotein [Pseudomonas syringae pv. actinidiae]GBH19148.1 Choline dehydrogenase or related flavoprotein [Pseudomonas syringae pv. actinidiae]